MYFAPKLVYPTLENLLILLLTFESQGLDCLFGMEVPDSPPIRDAKWRSSQDDLSSQDGTDLTRKATTAQEAMERRKRSLAESDGLVLEISALAEELPSSEKQRAMLEQKDNKIAALEETIGLLKDSLKRTEGSLDAELQGKVREIGQLQKQLDSQKGENTKLLEENHKLLSAIEDHKKQFALLRDKLKDALSPAKGHVRVHPSGLSSLQSDGDGSKNGPSTANNRAAPTDDRINQFLAFNCAAPVLHNNKESEAEKKKKRAITEMPLKVANANSPGIDKRSTANVLLSSHNIENPSARDLSMLSSRGAPEYEHLSGRGGEDVASTKFLVTEPTGSHNQMDCPENETSSLISSQMQPTEDQVRKCLRVLPDRTPKKQKKIKTSAACSASKGDEVAKSKRVQYTEQARELAKIKVGARVEIWWAGGDCYYKGTVMREGIQNNCFFVKYDDGEEAWVDFGRPAFRLVSNSDDDAAGVDDCWHLQWRRGGQAARVA